MAVSNADYATLVTALRNCLAHGIGLTGIERKLALDVLLHAVNTLDGNTTVTTANTDADALEVLLALLSTAVGTANTDADALETLLVTEEAAVIQSDADAVALEALLVTHFAIIDAIGAGDASVEIDAMIAACATPRSDLVTNSAAALAASTACVAPRATLVTSVNAAVTANSNCTTPRSTLVTSMNAAVAAGGTAIDDITASDFLDGNET